MVTKPGSSGVRALKLKAMVAPAGTAIGPGHVSVRLEMLGSPVTSPVTVPVINRAPVGKTTLSELSVRAVPERLRTVMSYCSAANAWLRNRGAVASLSSGNVVSEVSWVMAAAPTVSPVVRTFDQLSPRPWSSTVAHVHESANSDLALAVDQIVEFAAIAEWPLGDVGCNSTCPVPFVHVTSFEVASREPVPDPSQSPTRNRTTDAAVVLVRSR